MVSSRFEELGSSRRAAFDALLDAGCIPIMYEGIPLDEVSEDPKHYPGDAYVSAITDPSLRERMRIDELLEMSDAFVGIYADSVGDIQPHLSHLRPIEYELLSFCARLFRTKRAMRELFPDPVRNMHPADLQGLREKHSQLWIDIRNALQLVSIRELLAHRRVRNGVMEFDRLVETSGACQLASNFKTRVLLMRKTMHGDHATSSMLQSALHGLPHQRYHAVRPSGSVGMELEHGDSFVPAQQRLYESVLDWAIAARELLGYPSLSDARRRGVMSLIVRSEMDKGYIRVALRELFVGGYNVEQLRLGSTRRGRAMMITVTPYRPDPKREDLVAERISAAIRSLKPSRRRTRAHNEKDEVRWLPPGEAAFGDFEEDTDCKNTVAIDCTVADVPGMLFKVAGLINQYVGKIKLCTLLDRTNRTPSWRVRAIRIHASPDRAIPRKALGRSAGDLLRAQKRIASLVGVYSAEAYLEPNPSVVRRI
jgi:hypothetical protein